MLRLLSHYDKLLIARPITTKVATATFLTTATDVGLQRLANPSAPASSHDVHRTFRHALWSGPIMGPGLHYWFNWLARIPGFGPIPGPVVRLAVDSATLMPASHVAYVAYMSSMMYGSTEHVATDINDKLGPLLKSGYAAIPPVMLINLWVVPLRFQLLFVNVTLGVCYAGWMNYVMNSQTAAAAADKAKKQLRRNTTSYS